MSISLLNQTVNLIGGRARAEVSGCITLDLVRAIAEIGVDFISVVAI